MNYYVMKVTRVEGQDDAIAVTKKTTKEDAKMLFHQIMAGAYATANLEYAMAQITNEYGAIEALEVWRKETEETV